MATGMESSEKLEMVFRQIEEESERRAREEEESSSLPGPLEDLASSTSTRRNSVQAKKRRRGSISISRIGTDLLPLHQAENPVATLSAPNTPMPWSPSPVYRHSGVYQAAGSASSLTSDESQGLSAEEDHHTTQKETIIGRRNTLTKAMTSIISKTLTHVRSKATLPSHDDPMIIGISVEEATVEYDAQHGGEASSTVSGPEPISTRVIRTPEPPRGLRARSQSLSMIARNLTQKFRRRKSYNKDSTTSLTQPADPPQAPASGLDHT